MNLLVAILCGALFGAGLVISDMIDPTRVRAFLDVTGDWDPTLAFVMGGALLVMVPAWQWIRRRSEPVLDHEFHLPGEDRVDRGLVTGAAIFGAGWGLAGLCPGPAVAGLATLDPAWVVFLATMLTGIWLSRRLALT